MTKFSDLVKSGKLEAAFLTNKVALASVDDCVQSICELDKVTPNARTFSRYETRALEVIKTLNLTLDELNKLLFKAEPNIDTDVDYVSIKKYNRDQITVLYNVMDEYISVLHDKGIPYPSEIKHGAQPDLASIVSTLVKSQKEDITSLVKSQEQTVSDIVSGVTKSQSENIELLSKTSSPKHVQPIFTSEQNNSDYSNFRDFLDKFLFYTKRCASNSERLEWLKSSIKGEAYNLIRHLSLVEDNYDIALKRLKDKYLDSEIVKHTLVQSILNFKCESGARYTKAQASLTTLSNVLEELKSVHNLPIGEELCKAILREAIFYKLPSDIRVGLIDACNTNYPSIENILDNVDQVIKRLNIKNLSSRQSNNTP